MKKKEMLSFLQKLNVSPRNEDLYVQALTHSSYANEKGLPSHNERLEFLGDVVLGLVISEMLYNRFPDLPEGKLTRFRSELVREETLSELAGKLELGQHLRLSKGESASGGRKRPSILADAMEAIFGALYLDLGLEEARRVILSLYGDMLNNLENGGLHNDYKTLIQEYSQATFAATPQYKIVAEEGPDHSKRFLANILINNRVYGEGFGKTKKEAEQQAAYAAYRRLVKPGDN